MCAALCRALCGDEQVCDMLCCAALENGTWDPEPEPLEAE